MAVELTPKERILCDAAAGSAGPGAAFRVAGRQEGARCAVARQHGAQRLRGPDGPRRGAGRPRVREDSAGRRTLPQRVGLRRARRRRKSTASRSSRRSRRWPTSSATRRPIRYAAGRYAPIEKALETYGDHYAVIVHLNDVFSLPRYLMGMENLLMAIAAEPELVTALVDMSVDINLKLAKESAGARRRDRLHRRRRTPPTSAP